MSYDDFIKHFDQVQMCHIEPDLVGRNLATDAVMGLFTVFAFLNDAKLLHCREKETELKD